MQILIAMFNAGVTLVILILALASAYLGHRVIHGIRLYFRFRGARLVACPETHSPALVHVDARSTGMQAIWDKRCLRLSECSRWPGRVGCGQECLSQIEARPAELRFSASYRAS